MVTDGGMNEGEKQAEEDQVSGVSCVSLRRTTRLIPV